MRTTLLLALPFFAMVSAGTPARAMDSVKKPTGQQAKLPEMKPHSVFKHRLVSSLMVREAKPVVDLFGGMIVYKEPITKSDDDESDSIERYYELGTAARAIMSQPSNIQAYFINDIGYQDIENGAYRTCQVNQSGAIFVTKRSFELEDFQTRYWDKTKNTTKAEAKGKPGARRKALVTAIHVYLDSLPTQPVNLRKQAFTLYYDPYTVIPSPTFYEDILFAINEYNGQQNSLIVFIFNRQFDINGIVGLAGQHTIDYAETKDGQIEQWPVHQRKNHDSTVDAPAVFRVMAWNIPVDKWTAALVEAKGAFPPLPDDPLRSGGPSLVRLPPSTDRSQPKMTTNPAEKGTKGNGTGKLWENESQEVKVQLEYALSLRDCVKKGTVGKHAGAEILKQ
jgi:hypothetical protein